MRIFYGTKSQKKTFSLSNYPIGEYELEREKVNRLQSEMDTAFSELAEM